MQSPPMSQVEVDTRPMEADAFAPKLPTMAASIYCIAMELISARIAGMLRLITLSSCLLRSDLCPEAAVIEFSLNGISSL